MKLHANAALSLNKRRLLVRRVVEEDWSLTKAAEAAEVSEPTVRKWVVRYLAEGEGGLLDRSSAAHRVHNRTPEDRIEAICALRRLRLTSAELADANVDELPAARSGSDPVPGALELASLAGDQPVTGAASADPSQPLDVDVDELPGRARS
jgi:leucine-zipper of insertion element IS481